MGSHCTHAAGWPVPACRQASSQRTELPGSLADRDAAVSGAGADVPIRQDADLAGWGAGLVTPARRRAFPGKPEQVALARRFVAGVLDGCPAADTAVLLASELAANALSHTRSGAGGSFDVIVWRGVTAACIAVLDDGTAQVPAPGPADRLAEAGRGLALVNALAARWGHCGGTTGRAVWFLLRWARP
jgi:anti-sigma regulatory factor (Ser/Thr protein kinase)